MRLLACDFDGTVFRNHDISAEDRAALSAWRAGGNLFGIVTGRGALTLLAELGRFPVGYDFLLCNNGALLLDARDKVVASRPLDHDLARTILAHEIGRHCVSCAVFAGVDMYVLEGSTTWINPVYTPKVLSLEAAGLMEFVQISFGFYERELSLRWGQRLQRDLALQAKVQCSLSVADVTSLQAGKALGIAWALQVMDWQPDDVIVAGDDGNDLEMIAAYGGYAMEDADEEVRACAGRTVPSIAALVERLG